MVHRYCVRVRIDGAASDALRDAEGVSLWLDHNRTFRPDEALFVDGRLASPLDGGLLGHAAIEEIENLLVGELAAGAHSDRKPDAWGLQKEREGHGWRRWEGYPLDRPRRPVGSTTEGPVAPSTSELALTS